MASSTHQIARYWKRALDRGVSVNSVADGDSSLCHHAIRYNNPALLEFAIMHGADLECKDSRGDRPLHKATEKKQVPCMQLLLQHKADVHAKGKVKDTPLQIAHMNAHDAAIQLLLEHKATYMGMFA